MNSNLSILQQNICISLSDNEAERIFLQYCEYDIEPYYKAEKFARMWLTMQGLLSISKNLYPDAPHDEIKDFIKARLPNAWECYVQKSLD